MLLRLALSICAINTTMQKTLNGNKKKYLAAMLVLMGTTSALATTTASADSTQLNLKQNVHSGDFDLTKQVGSTMDFPVMFDRPSGVNAAALAGTVQALGTDSALYKSALKAVPELSDTNKINSLLSDALDSGSANYNSARNTIVKLINWYNSLGGTRITTQSGQAYTTANLDQPINVLAVAFSNSDSVNQKATTALANINASRTVGDVARALDAIQSGLSVPYTTAFDAYASKVYAPNANLNDLTQYSAVSGVLNAYEGMYANGASAIRKELLNGEAKSTEAGVTFFESAVLAGNTSTGGGDSTGGNTPTTKTEYHTRWVDESGKDLATPSTSETGYENSKTINGYHLVSNDVNGDTNTKTYHYEKDKTPEPKKIHTTWVDEHGNKLKPDEDGAHPDNDGKSDVPGYDLIKVTTDKDGNVTNTYKKHEEPKPEVVTHWVDEQGNKLKDDEKGAHPDNDGTSDIEGYDIVRVTTDENGNVTNVYRKHEEPTPQPTEKNHTYWVDTDGNTLKPSEEGQYPDNDGKSDIDGYDLVASYTVTAKDLAKGGNFEGTDYKAGDVINIYKKHEEPKADIVTHWVDENGNKLKDDEKGSHPDNDGVSDISGYEVISVKTDNDGNITNVYRKIDTTHTTWVDENGNKLKPDEDGSHPDNDGVSDIDGYEVIAVKTDKDGNITNVYRKISKIKTSWVDEQGNKLKDDEDGSHPDNDGVSDIDGYEVIAVKTDKDGNITNVYRKINKIKTSWVDENGAKLKPDEDGSHPDNDGVSDIDGYALVTVKTDEDGNVTNIYRKLNQVHTSWVDTEGDKLKPDEDGAHPDTDGKSDIDGYKLVSVKKDKDGNIVNTYEKIPAEKPETPAPAPTPKPAPTPTKQATPTPVATPTATPASQKTLPQTGSNDDLISAAALGASSIVALLGGLTIKKRKHEN